MRPTLQQVHEQIGGAALAAPAVPRAPEQGPGTELEKVFASIGVEKKPGCDCARMIAEMNQWGPALCRQRLDRIVDRLREGVERFGWWEKLKAAAHIAASKRILTIDLADPFRSLVLEAIARAEK